MEPRISYARTSDGLDIAYAVSGSGPVLISVPSPPDNHIQLELDQPGGRESVEALSAHRTLVRFDGRGTGLSTREVTDFSLEARLRDLDAVVSRVGTSEFALLAGTQGCQLAVAYAALHSERVTHLVAVNPFIRGLEFLPDAKMKLLEVLLAQDFEIFTETVGALTFGWGTEEGPRFGRYFRQCVGPSEAIAIYRAMNHVDLAPYLGRVRCPVLVLGYETQGMGSPEATRRFAAAVPESTIALIRSAPGPSAGPEIRDRIAAFFGEDWGPPPAAMPHARAAAPGSLRIMLFTDLEDHTAMMQRLGDERGREVLREHERLTREALAAHAGTEVKSMGDGFLATFTSAQGALACAIDLQRRFGEASHHLPAELSVRVGVNAGEPIAEGDDVFGTSVIAASRIADMARGGQVLVSNVVRELVAGKGFLFADSGEHILRGMEDPVRVWELRWAE